MIISMQGNWTVTVKSKNASYPQRFIVQGATVGNGIHSGTVGTTVNVIGNQWSIAIQNNPGKGFQLSKTKLKFPNKVGGKYEFDILSDDAGGDSDFNDMILTCSTPASINDFIIYGNVTLYSGRCIFNPCRRFPFVIDTYPGLIKALKNPLLHDWIKKYYPERIPPVIVNPNPPDPPYFEPIVFDLKGEAMQPKTMLKYNRKIVDEKKRETKADKDAKSEFDIANFDLIAASNIKANDPILALSPERIKLAEAIEGLIFPCFTNVGSNLTLKFEEYDRTAAELAGGAYSGTGNRRILGDSITDTNGNYIFRFRFDMTLPGLEDSTDITSGEDVNTVMFPDVIVKVVEYSPYHVKYESAPFNNVPNLKRIDLCLPESRVHVTSTCFNGNLIGSIGNVFLGGAQNTSGSISDPALKRYDYGNFLEPSGKISVGNPNALFAVECAAWGGTLDLKGCMYDTSKSPADNKISWYTVRIRRSTAAGWVYVSQNYKHPIFGSHPINYIGDNVGPFYPVAGSLDGSIPAYKNIQREKHVDGIPWLNDSLDRFMQLNTGLYDVLEGGERTPGKFYVRVDGYTSAGAYVPGATDLIAIFIHNKGLKFGMTTPTLNDPSIVNAGCGLFRLTDAQMKTPFSFSFEASDPEGFVDSYALTMGRCPGTPLLLNSNIDPSFTLTGNHLFPKGNNPPPPANVHHGCPGYTGTILDYSTSGLVNVQINPPAVGDGWIKPGEYFTVYSFGLSAGQRVTNGYNNGIHNPSPLSVQIMMERLNP